MKLIEFENFESKPLILKVVSCILPKSQVEQFTDVNIVVPANSPKPALKIAAFEIVHITLFDW